MHICIRKVTIIGSANGLSPGWHQTIIRTNSRILLIGPLGTNLSETLNRNLNIFFQENTFENIIWKMVALLSSSWPQCVNPLCAKFF